MQRVQGYIKKWDASTNQGVLKKSTFGEKATDYLFTSEDVENFPQVTEFLQPSKLFSFEDAGDGHARKLRRDVGTDEAAYTAPITHQTAAKTSDLMADASRKGSLFGEKQ